MKPIIGIITRKSKSESNLDIDIIYSDTASAIIKSGGIPIGISNNNFLDYLSICNGFILQGGSNLEEDNLKIINTLYEKDIPLLGICLGMQEIASNYNGIIYNVTNHKHNNLHEITISRNSLLYKILGCKKTLVNSRHSSAIKNTSLNISARSNDEIVEAIEDKNKKFFLGLEWHPENLYEKDLNSRKIFNYFIKACQENDC